MRSDIDAKELFIVEKDKEIVELKSAASVAHDGEVKVHMCLVTLFL